MFIKLLCIFIVLPLAELYILLKVGALIGTLPTLALILLTGLAGAHLTRSQGFAVVHRLRQELAEGRLPGETLIDGGMILAGGVLLLTPGLLTDLLGFLLLTPLTRPLLRRFIVARLQRLIDEGQVKIHRR